MQSVVTCVAETLESAPEIGVAVYQEFAPDASLPYLLVLERRWCQTHGSGASYLRQSTVEVQYHTQDEPSGLANLRELLAELLLRLEYGGQALFAEELRSFTKDGVLHFQAVYPMRVRLTRDKTLMQELEIDQNLKEE